MQTDKRKVLIIATTKFELDGITNVILNYYRAMDKSDMQFDFAVPNILKIELRKEIENQGSNIFIIQGRNKNPLSYMRKLTNLIKRNNYDIVHAHGNSSTLAMEMVAAKRGGSKVRIPHSHNTTTNHRVVHKLLRRTFDKNYTNGFACGVKAGEWLYKGKPFTVINNGIDVNRFKFNEEDRKNYRKKYGLVGCKVIGNVGAFNYQKNHEFLTDVFFELYKLDKSYRLLLIGDGGLRTEIEKKVDSLGLNNAVIFAGKSREVPQLLQVMDAIVMPSRYEGLPLSLIEAQSASLPCFVSDVITQEIGVTDLIKFIPLEKKADTWAKIINDTEIMNSRLTNDKSLYEITEAGYNIKENAQDLQNLYNLFLTNQLKE
ncbi:glycosyltransferase family 1 protein [Halobacillus kuroshimensis]|uniref:glycosyltransferase family 1 protein n=1 Tax=Halobacillus kuroshimensis TaxID=302481 RepID=UPI000429DD07|nr:glycosyltransferase family 1 protein [Halobacillus kuroshimensis]